MSRVDIDLNPKAKASHWTTVSISIVEAIDHIFVGKEFKHIGVYTAVVQLIDLALKGYPLINYNRSAVYMMVKDVMTSALPHPVNDESAIFLLTSWRNIIEIDKGQSFRHCNEEVCKAHLELMRAFFEFLWRKGEQESSNQFYGHGDDE